MNKKFYAAAFLVLLSFGIFSFYRIEPLQLKISFSFQLNVPKENPNNYNGSCYVYADNINFSTPKNPSFSREDIIELNMEPYYQDQSRETPVHFQLMLKLNTNEKIIEIGNLDKVSYYKGVGICYVDVTGAGNYNLSLTSVVNGVIDEDRSIEIVLEIP